MIIENLFFGENFLKYIDSLFFYLLFSSLTEATKSRAGAGAPLEEWTTIRNNLVEDHHSSKNHHLLIQVWKDYVNKEFLAVAGSDSIAASAPLSQCSLMRRSSF